MKEVESYTHAHKGWTEPPSSHLFASQFNFYGATFTDQTDQQKATKNGCRALAFRGKRTAALRRETISKIRRARQKTEGKWRPVGSSPPRVSERG